MEEEKFLTAPEVARILGIGSQTLRRWGDKGLFIPHHVSPSGYRYYSEGQVHEFLATRKVEEKVDCSGSEKKKKRNILSKNLVTDADTKKEPVFRLYVDAGTGKTWFNYYSMRSGKTNALAFANNPKLFDRMTEMVNGYEIISNDDGYKFLEKMHNVTITLDGEHLNNLSVVIAKCVFWIQLSFTKRLGYDHPSDEVIEEARYMHWNIDDYMSYCGLSDRKSAIESMKNILDLLSHAEIQWQEEITVRGSDGKPVIVGSHKDKNGKNHVKVKKTLQTYRGVFISTRGLKPMNGGFDYWINKEFATYLAHAGVIAVHEGIFRLDAKHHPSSITLALKLLEYYGMNRNSKQANIISVKSLINAMPLIPKYEDLTSKQKTIQADGQIKVYEKHGNKGGWRTRILQPFEVAFKELVNHGILTNWKYREDGVPKDYEDFYRRFVEFEFYVDDKGDTNESQSGNIL